MLEYNEVKEGKYIIYEGEPYEVVSSHVFRKQQRKPVNATKLRNLISGRIIENSFHVSDKVEEAEIPKKEIKYLYNNRGEFWFCEPNDPSKRFKIEESMIGNASKFLKENSVVEALLFNDPEKSQSDHGAGAIFAVKLPIKVELRVTESAPAVKGNTAQNATKSVKLETGAELQVPMFIKQDDIVRVNTETGQYTDRVTN
jgi:elongation factor P